MLQKFYRTSQYNFSLVLSFSLFLLTFSPFQFSTEHDTVIGRWILENWNFTNEVTSYSCSQSLMQLQVANKFTWAKLSTSFTQQYVKLYRQISQTTYKPAWFPHSINKSQNLRLRFYLFVINEIASKFINQR